MDESYKLKTRDFIPYFGAFGYMKRNDPDKKTEPRALALVVYNASLFIGLMANANRIADGLESILR